MKETSSKIASPYAVSWVNITDCQAEDIVGTDKIKVQAQGIGGGWKKIDCTEVSLTEKYKDEGYDVNLSVRITDTSKEMQRQLLDIRHTNGLVKIDYTDGLSRILGTGDCPVRLELTKEGTPAQFKLSYKGYRPELTKILQSF